MANNYVDAETFKEFKENQQMMIETFNHNVTKISENVEEFKNKFGQAITNAVIEITQIKTIMKANGTIIKWIASVGGGVLIAAVVAQI